MKSILPEITQPVDRSRLSEIIHIRFTAAASASLVFVLIDLLDQSFRFRFLT
jgi:hypothetical protein